MPPIDPAQLLKALGTLLTPTGGIKGLLEAKRIASLMKDAQKLVSRCVYVSILRATENDEVLQWFLQDGTWDTLNQWLQEAKDSDNTPFLVELLKAYQQIPVTIEILKKNNAAKSIKQLSKSSDINLQTLADNIVKDWMKKIKVKPANGDETSPAEKKMKKHRDSKDSSRGVKDSKENSKNSKEVKKSDDSDHHHRHGHKHSDKQEKTDSDTTSSATTVTTPTATVLSSDDKPLNKDNNDSPESPPPSSTGDKDDEKPSSEHSPLSLKIHINKADNSYKVERTFGALEEEKSKKAKTVKVRPQRFRSIGVIEDIIPLPKKKASAESQKPVLNPKRASTTRSDEPPEKKTRPIINTALAASLASSSIEPSNSNNSTPSSLSPTEIHGRIKIIPPRSLKAHEKIQDSSGFMNALTAPAALRKRKKNSISGPSSGPSTKPSPTSPTSASTSTANPTSLSRNGPAVPSFYRDTLVTPEREEPLETGSRSPSPVQEPDIKPDISQDVEHTDSTKLGEADIKTEPLDIKTEPASDQTQPGNGVVVEVKPFIVRKKRRRKTVTWVDDSCLTQIYYFEMDEFERENVNRAKDFNLTKKEEMMRERMAMQHGKRLINDGMVETIDWYRPHAIDGLNILSEPGMESNEKEVQRIREQSVLQSLFFSKDMLPDAPSEADLESVERVEPKLIPLEDSTSESSEELHYTYDNTEVSNKIVIAPPQVENSSSNLSGPLPPELINLLRSLTQGNQQANPGGNNNMMPQVNAPPFIPELGPLLAALNSNDPKKQETATQKLRTLLEPYKDQLPGLLMQHSMGNMNPLNAHMNNQMQQMNPQMNFGIPPPTQQQLFYGVPDTGPQSLMGPMGMPPGNMGPQQGGMGMNMQQGGGMMGPQQGNMGMQQGGGMMGQNQGGMMSPPHGGNMGMQQGNMGMQQGSMGMQQGGMGTQGNMGMQQGGGASGGLLGAAPPGFQPLQQQQHNMNNNMQQGDMRNQQRQGFKHHGQHNDQDWDDNYHDDNYHDDNYRDDRRSRGRGGRGRGGDYYNRGRGPSRGGRRDRERKTICFHFVGRGGCRFGNQCTFMHPGDGNSRS